MAVMDPTGGLRDIRSLNTAYSPIPRETGCQDDDWNTQSDGGALPLPVISQRISYTKQKALHRSRLVFRIVSLVASGTALGSFGDVVWSYMKTRDARSHHGNEKIWPDDIAHFSCVYMMISAAVITFVVDFGWFIASIKPEVRQLQGNKLKAICGAVEAVCLALMIAGVAVLEKAQGDKKEKWLGWVCEAKTLHSHEASMVDFPFLCGEVKAARVAMYLTLAVQVVLVLTVIIDFFYRPGYSKFVLSKEYRMRRPWEKFLNVFRR
ncbi:hypothetical protein BZA77DRAFT_299966 [Pyronema omphalodes]|nr:hypothetical protein BZA77DRAFT_299966 [Pyronema omphalodes]